MKDYESRMKELGVSFPDLPPAAGAYVPAVRSEHLYYQGTFL